MTDLIWYFLMFVATVIFFLTVDKFPVLSLLGESLNLIFYFNLSLAMDKN
jgi:hypothetical protein